MKIKIFLTAVAALMLTTACNDTDIDLFSSPSEDQGQGTLRHTGSTVSTLDFAWEPVDNVYQYGYTLYMDASAVRQGVTQETSIHFDNLETDTEYSLHIECFGFNGASTKVYVLTARTNGVTQLATPDLSAPEFANADGVVTISWPAVENAGYYTCTLTSELLDEPTVTIVETSSVSFSGLANGDYTLTVVAGSDDDNYVDSYAATYEFNLDRVAVATYTGTYSSILFGSYECQIVIYDDGVYSIKKFYGFEGYDLEFSLGANNVVTFTNHYYQSGAYKYIATGYPTDGDYYAVAIYESTDYVEYTKSGSTCTLEFYVYVGDTGQGGYEKFVWTE